MAARSHHYTDMAARSHHYKMLTANNTVIRFRGFNKRGDVRVYNHGDLPHWRQDGCIYFVTFRLADSLPVAIVQQIASERSSWLIKRGIDPDDTNWRARLAKLSDAEQRTYERYLAHITNEQLDKGYGACVLRRRDVAKIVEDALKHFHDSRVLTGDYVIMPNHVHVLMTPLPGFELEDILHSIKSFTSNEINRLVAGSGEFWQRQNYDHIVRDFEQLEAFQGYIAQNPKKANLPAGEFVHNSAHYIPDE